jgi:AcrR family transcriptional regulator
LPRPPGHGAAFLARRHEIIDIAARLIARHGYAAMGIAELAEAVQMGKGGLYRYIGSKEQLLVEIQDRVVGPLVEATRPVVALELDPLVRLRLASEILLSVIVARQDHVRVYEQDHRNLRGENRRIFVKRWDEYQALIRGVIEEAIAAGTFRPVDPNLATLEFLNLHNRTYQWYDPRGPWDVEFLSREYCATLFSGLSARGPDQVLEAAVARARADIVSQIPAVVAVTVGGQRRGRAPARTRAGYRASTT